ncbi:MAG: hypothetical protein JWO09_1621 [Bacteroidetes bacterium]|nr:hypothetical protein [Bacteroidota bacterium]
MNINKHNYEAFFLDYHEGNLTPQEVAELLLFVEQHPELKEEFECFENFTLEDYSAYNFENKEGLKKQITETNREDYFIRAVDGTLTNTENGLLDQFLKQHPQYALEFELFRKTKLVPDLNIVFEHKAQLKRVPETAENLLISAMEGLLSKEENTLLDRQLAVDPELRRDFTLYKQTKLSADTSVVYENKEELKRRERKIIPFYYYASAIAAAVLLLFGLFFVFNNATDTEQDMAHNHTTAPKEAPAPAAVKEESPAVEEMRNVAVQPLTASVAKNESRKQKNHSPEKDSLKAHPVINPAPQNIAQNIPENKQDAPQEQIAPLNNVQDNNTASNPVAKADDTEKAPSKEFLSLGQIAAAKLKEKTLDPEVLAMEKKNGKLKKISGWDVLQMVAKGASRLTGKKVEAKPTYNEEGEITAYALGAGSFQFSKGKKSN